jgi:DNA-binding SARP family transcriptional activator
VEIRVLGELEALGEAGRVPLRARKHRQLLAALVIGLGEVCSADALIEALWRASPPASAAKLLQVYVSQLRRMLPAAVRIGTRGSGYVLELGELSLDAARFERLLEEGKAASREGNVLALMRDFVPEAPST